MAMDHEVMIKECFSGFTSEQIKEVVDSAKRRQFEMAKSAQERSENFNFDLLGSVNQFF